MPTTEPGLSADFHLRRHGFPCNAWRTFDAQRAQVQADAMRVVKLIAANQERLTVKARNLLEVLVRFPVVGNMTTTSCDAFLTGLMPGFPEYLNVGLGGKVLPTATLSLGVATFPQHGTSWQSVLRAADEALYAAKELGRNRVASPDAIASASDSPERPAPLAPRR